MFLIIFSCLLSVLGFFSIKRKSYLSFFIPMILFLPDYYGIDIAPGLPLITVSRILFVILYLYILFSYRDNITNTIKSLKISLPMILLGGYFLLRIITNLYYIRKYGSSINTILSIVFEELLLLLIAIVINLSKRQIFFVVNVIVYSSVVMYLLGIFESFSFIRITNNLYTINRYALNDWYVRMGLLRATVTLGLPGVFGNMCALMIPAILYMYYRTFQKRYIIILALNIMACIHSGTRSSLIFLLAIYAISSVPFIKSHRMREYFKTTFAAFFSVFLIICILSIANKNLSYYYSTSGKAILNTIGFDFDLNSGAPNGIKGYGRNEDGNMSRLVQLSGLKYAASVNPLFGLGSKAQIRNEVCYYMNGRWKFFSTYDLGYVQEFMDEGIIGSIGFICLFIALFYLSSSKKCGDARYFLTISLVSYLICMLGTANMYYYLWTQIFIIVSCYRANDSINTT